MKQSLFISTLVELADNLVEDFDILDLLTMLSCRCAEVLDASAVGVILVTPEGKLQCVASSDESMHVLEVFQMQTQEGPAVDCFRTGLPVVRLSIEEGRTRWPKFAPMALEKGYQSVHSVPLRLRSRTIGSLNLFRTSRGEMDSDDALLVQAMADIAAIAILQHRSVADATNLNDQLTNALGSRVIIEQAKGIVSNAEDCDMAAAFAYMRAYARNNNKRLSDVAAKIVDGSLLSGELDSSSPANY